MKESDGIRPNKYAVLIVIAATVISLGLFVTVVSAGSGHEHSSGKKHDMSVTMDTENEKPHMSGPPHPVKGGDVEEYLSMMTPAGFDAVIGRKNTLRELTPEIVREKGRTVKVFSMTIEDVKFEIFPGRMIEGWGFNGQVPGPTLRVQEGDTVRVIVTNKQKEEHTLHVHGQIKPVIMDGVPYVGQKPIKEGETYTYEFVARNIGTSWYHCHVDSAHHVDMGMYGAFIVEAVEKKVKYDREYIMILDEWPTSHIHLHEDVMPMEGHDEHGIVTKHEGTPSMHMEMDKKTAPRNWYPKTHKKYQPVYDGFTVNGRSFPFTEPVDVKAGERVRIRLINVGYQPHFMHTHSHKFQVVARDGSWVEEPQKIDTVQVGPGQRVDIILFADNPGIWPFHCHRLDHVANDAIYPGGLMTFIRYID